MKAHWLAGAVLFALGFGSAFLVKLPSADAADTAAKELAIEGTPLKYVDGQDFKLIYPPGGKTEYLVATVRKKSSLPELKVDNDNLVARVVDVADEQQVKDVIAFAVRTFGKLDGIVNNAGVLIPGTILDASVEDYQRTFDVNVKGVFLGSRYAIPELIKAGGGSIVNFGSINSIGAEKLLATYTASKGAVLTLTKAIALDFGAQGVRANTLCPGFVDTPLNVPHYTALGGREELEAGLPDF